MLLIKRGLIIFHNSLIIKAQYCRRENISICSKTYLSVTVAYSIAQVTHLRQTGALVYFNSKGTVFLNSLNISILAGISFPIRCPSKSIE